MNDKSINTKDIQQTSCDLSGFSGFIQMPESFLSDVFIFGRHICVTSKCVYMYICICVYIYICMYNIYICAHLYGYMHTTYIMDMSRR